MYHKSKNTVRYTKENLEQIIKLSKSYREVLVRLKIVPAGGNYFTLKKYIQRFSISTSHFLGMAANKGKKFSPRRDLKDYLSNKVYIQTYKLKNRLLKEGILQRKCNCCNLTEWRGNQIPLEIHHRDGNIHNNSLNNLELLCPNCHSQTSTFRGKNTTH